MNGSYEFQNNQLTMKTTFHAPEITDGYFYQTYCQMLNVPNSWINEMRTAPEEETTIPSLLAYTADTWAVQFYNRSGLSSLTKGDNSNISLGNLDGSSLLSEASDPLFIAHTSNDAQLAAETVSTDPLWSFNQWATYAEADNLSTETRDGLFNKGQGYVFETDTYRPSTGSYGHSLKVGERSLMVCGYQIIDATFSTGGAVTGTSSIVRQASSPTDLTQAIELNLVESGAQALVNTAAAVVAISAALSF